MNSTDLDINISVEDVAAIVDANDLASIRAAGYLAGRFSAYRANNGDYDLAAHAGWASVLVTQARLIEWRDLMDVRRAVRAEMKTVA